MRSIKYALKTDEDNRIIEFTFDTYADDTYTLVDSAPNHYWGDCLFIDGEYIYDPLPRPEPEPTSEYVTYDELAEAIREGVNRYGA